MKKLIISKDHKLFENIEYVFVTQESFKQKEIPTTLPFIPPISLGSDTEAVDWVNLCLVTVFTSPSMYRELINMWLQSLSNYTKSSDSEVE